MLELCTGSRLHFGLLELARGQPHRFGGLGLMLKWPQLLVEVRDLEGHSVDRIRAGNVSRATAEIQHRVQVVIARAESALGRRLPEQFALRVAECPPIHSGLGCGTQLAAAIASAAQLVLSPPALLNQAPPARGLWRALVAPNACQDVQRVAELTRLSGRGKRSAIGLHGFLYGGLVQDMGYDAHEPEWIESSVRPLDTRSCPLPSDWRVVLITSSESGDMHGIKEENLMDRAGDRPNSRRSEMLTLSDTCLEAGSSGDFLAFTSALQQYMDIASSLFAPVQAGRYRDLVIAQRVKLALDANLLAVGQSSWGPTVFGFAPTQAAAERAADPLRRQLVDPAVSVHIACVANQGAQWRTVSSGVQHAR